MLSVTKWTIAVGILSLLLLDAGSAWADPPGVVYYSAPVVTYYSPPVYYRPAPRVAYYYAPPVAVTAPAAVAPSVYYPPTVSYYPPTVSYYAPPVAYAAPPVTYYPATTAVTTFRYGLLGRPRVTTYYYP
jgi:hypothetical protein